ncbi:MAG: hypothetical protein IKO05_04750 [Selenomonadaceae bacterium]|nr:hypothetical protein [Selenomonadaceae bacterium]
MAELEQRVENLETKVMTVERHVDQVMTKLDMFIEESREIRRRQDADRQRQDAEIREIREKHDADMREIRQDMKDMQKNIYAKMDTMDAKIENIGNHVRNMFLVALGGIAAMVVAVFLK